MSVSAERHDIGVAKCQTASAPAQVAVGTSAVSVLPAVRNSRAYMIQNTGTTIIKLAFGADPTQTAYHVALKNGSAADDGSGGVWIDDIWIGEVRAISSGSGGTIVVTELF